MGAVKDSNLYLQPSKGSVTYYHKGREEELVEFRETQNFGRQKG